MTIYIPRACIPSFNKGFECTSLVDLETFYNLRKQIRKGNNIMQLDYAGNNLLTIVMRNSQTFYFFDTQPMTR